MENRIKQEYRINKIQESRMVVDIKKVVTHELDQQLHSFIMSKYPVKFTEEQDDILLDRELYIFNREELEKFIAEVVSKQNKGWYGK